MQPQKKLKLKKLKKSTCINIMSLCCLRKSRNVLHLSIMSMNIEKVTLILYSKSYKACCNLFVTLYGV